MYKIVEKRTLNANTKLMVVDAPHVARKAEPGQFIILRVDENGERVPLTIAAYDREKGTITIIFQEVGASTKELGQKMSESISTTSPVRSDRLLSLRV